MLTLREFEVYLLIVGKAMSCKQIASRLGISYFTARHHQRHILEKMNMGSALELLVQYHQRETPCKH